MTLRRRLSRRSGRWSALATVLGILAMLVFAPALIGTAQANAIPGVTDCKSAPSPDLPGSGTASWFLQKPDPLPPVADPFAAHPTTTIYEQYGFAGLTFQTYDLGCGGFARDPLDETMNGLNNMLMQGPIILTAITGWVLGAAFHPDTMFGDLDKYIASVSQVLRDRVFNIWSLPLLVAGALYMINRARRRDLGSLAVWLGATVGLVTLLTLLSTYPTAAGRTADTLVTNTIGQVSAGFAGQDGGVADPATSAVANIHRATLYLPWAQGTFGSFNSAAADKYGPALFNAQALTWQEADLPADARKKVIEDKQTQFQDIMSKIKEDDPSVYEMVQGKKPVYRTGAAIVASVGSLFASAFLIVSGLLMLIAFILVRLAVMLAPVIITLGMFPPLLPRVRAVGEGVGAAVMGCVAFGIGAALDTFLIGQVMAPGSSLKPLNQILFIFVLGVAFFFILLPFANVHRAFRQAFNRAAGGFGAFGNRFRDGLHDDTTREQREAMEQQRQFWDAYNNRRPETPGAPMGTVFADSRRTSEHHSSTRGAGRRNDATAPPYREPERTALPNARPALPSGTRALPSGAQDNRAEHEAAKAARRQHDEARVPLEPDAIFRPDGSARPETMPTRAPRPKVTDERENYVFKPVPRDEIPAPMRKGGDGGGGT